MLLSVWSPFSAAAQVIISEFMASNTRTLADESGDYSDWIELQNLGSRTVNLEGWSLTDTRDDLGKWQFPAVSLPPGGFLVVFASGKDRLIAQLHTNFRLADTGEYLALVQPDQVTIAWEFAAPFPPHAPDISFGIPLGQNLVPLVRTGAVAAVFVPASDSLMDSWIQPDFDATAWPGATTPIGYQSTGIQFTGHIRTDITTAMRSLNATVYSRQSFAVADPTLFEFLTLRLQYDDGFVAYLNGFEVARRNAPEPSAWNSAATTPRLDAEAVQFDEIDISPHRSRLHVGPNYLAIQGINLSADDSDFLLGAELLATAGAPDLSARRYFAPATPGAPNGPGNTNIGPLILEVEHTPSLPFDADDLHVRALIRPAFDPVQSVILTYRVMYAAEATAPMWDDGQHADGAAGDGVFGAAIPGSVSRPGQMVRYFITATDAKGAKGRYPPYPDPRNSPQYAGTMVMDPTVTSSLPVLYWFVQNPSLADTPSGTRGSLFFEGEFYDNVGANRHGQSSGDFPKKSYDFDFNRGHKLRYATGQPRVDDFNLLTVYPDKAHMRNLLAYGVYRDAGSPYHIAFPVRVQTNGVFFSDAHFVENGDDNYLERLGLDPQGALYKMYNTLNSSTSGVEKKTRKRENNADLQALIAGTLRSGAARAQYLYDNVNLPEVINFLAAMIVTGGVDCCHKNYYLYRDTDGTGEWEMHPWDVDLTFGRNWNESRRYFDDTMFTNNSLFIGGNNLLPTAVFGTPPLRQSYLRRVRTLLDQLQQPPNTPAADLKFERQIDHWFTLLAPDAARDFAKWPTWGQRQTLTQAVNILRNEYLPARRAYTSTRLPGLPASQPAAPSLRFGALEVNPVSRNQQQEYFSVTNPNNYAVDLSGWRIAGAVQYTFRPGVVLPALGTVFLSPNVRAFRARPASPRGGEGLFVQGNYSGQLSARGETLRLLDGTREVARTNWPAQASLAQQYLRVTEIMYRPRYEIPTPGLSAEDFEFIELKNTGPVALELAGVHFADGIEFTFPTGAQLAPGAYALLVHNAAAFSSRYGNSLPVLGEFIGNLDNDGEKLRLEDAGGERILEFNYDPATHGITDGLGFSLVITNETLTWAEWENPDHWHPGDHLDGSPGVSGRAGPSPPVIINEVLAHSILPALDAVELHNPSSFPVDVSGWYLTDDRLTPKKFRLPPNTLLAGGGYRVISEFTSPAAGASGFSLSSAGDEIYLYSADSAGNLTGYADGFAFSPSPPMVTFGRHRTSDGSVSFPRQAVQSLGRANAGPQLGPVIINEIHPAPGDEPFVELRNLTTNTVNLWEAAAATGWKLNGLDFVFPPEARIAPSGLALVVSIDPVWFRSQYHIADNVPIFGPYPGVLQIDGERLELAQPTLTSGAAEVRFLEIDALRYENREPWPAAAAGLERRVPAGYAPDPASWRAPPAGPSPGIANDQNRPPSLQANDHVVQAALFPFRVFLTSNIADDGQSTAPVSPGIGWEQTAGPAPALVSTPGETNTWVTVPGPGVYRFRISTSDGQLSASDDLVLVVYGEGLTAWKVRYFIAIERANLAVSGDNADPDGDKLTNLQEYIAGTNPRDPLSYLRIEALSDGPDGTRLQFSAASGKSFVLEYRESLTSGTWQFLSEFPLEPVARTVDFLDTSTGSSQRFYRLVTRPQP